VDDHGDPAFALRLLRRAGENGLRGERISNRSPLSSPFSLTEPPAFPTPFGAGTQAPDP
jgi:hypothetical protein